jgi:ribonuclease P protein component
MPTLTPAFTFGKHERLTKKKEIETLFTGGQSFSKFPLRCVYDAKKNAAQPCLRMALSVPKKKIKRAVDRNRIKRLMREAWRLHKNSLSDDSKKNHTAIDVMLIYTGSVNPSFTLIQSKIVLILQRLSTITQKGHAPFDDSVTEVL